MSVELESLKQQITALPLQEKTELAAFLTEELRQLATPPPTANVGDDDGIRQRRVAWIKAHREEYAGQYVALDGDVLIAAGRTIREAHEQARARGIDHPYLVRITSEHETLSAGW